MSKGKLIVIEGLDGSGKGTQTELLYNHFINLGINVKKITFPDYDSDSSALVRMYLAGKFGDKPGDVNAYAASSFYAVDRFSSYKTYWGDFYNSGGVILADRYTMSNAIHQCSKLPREEWDGFLDWLFDYEWNKLGIPEPDAIFYLSVDPLISQKLMSGRYDGDESKKDIHEKDIEYLRKSRASAEYCSDKYSWNKIVCDNGVDGMRSVDDISSEISFKADKALNISNINSNEKNIKDLINRYPFLAPKDENGILNDFDYTWCMLFEIPDLWFDLCIDLCEELSVYLKSKNILDDYILLQVKEKYGELRWYGSIEDDDISLILNKYCEISKDIIV